MLDPGYRGIPSFPPEVLMFDARNGRPVYGISLVGLDRRNPDGSQAAWTLEFTADGRHLFVGTGHFIIAQGGGGKSSENQYGIKAGGEDLPPRL